MPYSWIRLSTLGEFAMLRRAGLLAVVLLMPSMGFAHDVGPGPHGGEVEDANPGPSLHFEVVVKGKTGDVYLMDENEKPLSTADVSGNVTVLADKKKDQVKLSPVGSGMMSGSGDFAADPNMRALVSLTVSGVKQQALFSRLGEQKP
jgi:hypothetical protein